MFILHRLFHSLTAPLILYSMPLRTLLTEDSVAYSSDEGSPTADSPDATTLVAPIHKNTSSSFGEQLLTIA